jgi:hypothetical protein
MVLLNLLDGKPHLEKKLQPLSRDDWRAILIDWRGLLQDQEDMAKYHTACTFFADKLQPGRPAHECEETLHNIRLLAISAVADMLKPPKLAALHEAFYYENPEQVRRHFNPSLLQDSTAAYAKVLDTLRKHTAGQAADKTSQKKQNHL